MISRVAYPLGGTEGPTGKERAGSRSSALFYHTFCCHPTMYSPIYAAILLCALKLTPWCDQEASIQGYEELVTVTESVLVPWLRAGRNSVMRC